MFVLDRSPDFGTGTMFMKDHRSGLSFSIKALLQNSRQVSSKSHNLKTSGGMPSGPAAFPVFSEDLTFLNSAKVKGSSLMSRSSKIFGISSSGSSTEGVSPRSFLKWVNHVSTLSSGLSPET